MPYKSREDRLEYARNYYTKNRVKLRGWADNKWPAGSDSLKTKNRQYRDRVEANPGAYKSPLLMNIRNRAKKLGLVCDLTEEWVRNPPTHCAQCNSAFVPSDRKLRKNIDRINPTVGYTTKNCEWLCFSCNRRKQDQTYEEMLEFAKRGISRTSKLNGF